MPRLEEYRPIVGEDVLEELRLLAGNLEGRSILHVNSTAVGGGVPLSVEAGVAVTAGGSRVSSLPQAMTKTARISAATARSLCIEFSVSKSHDVTVKGTSPSLRAPC